MALAGWSWAVARAARPVDAPRATLFASVQGIIQKDRAPRAARHRRIRYHGFGRDDPRSPVALARPRRRRARNRPAHHDPFGDPR
jgi:hypothetical protein